MAIRTGDWREARTDHSDLIEALNEDARGEAAAAGDFDPEPELEVYP